MKVVRASQVAKKKSSEAKAEGRQSDAKSMVGDNDSFPVAGTMRVVSMPALSSTVSTVPDHGSPSGIIVSVSAHNLVVREEIFLEANSLDDNVLIAMGQLVVYLNQRVKALSDKGDERTVLTPVNSLLIKMSVLVHRALYSAVLHGGSDTLHRLKVGQSAHSNNRLTHEKPTLSAWSLLSDVAFDASKLSKFLPQSSLRVDNEL